MSSIKTQLLELSQEARSAAQATRDSCATLGMFIVCMRINDAFPSGFLNHFVSKVFEVMYTEAQHSCTSNAFLLLELIDAVSL